MNTNPKDRQGCDVICRNHTARTEKDVYRISPSKLSKRELEDLYFALLENNLELKKTIHTQQDKLKVLSTRLQRLTVAQRSAVGKEKEGGATKVLIEEQRESISELRSANERMADRVRLLNMRLCSAKQFLKRSPSQSKCSRCVTAPPFKNSSLSALNTKSSDANVKRTTSFQYIENCPSTRDVQTETDKLDNDGTEKCNENKCRTQMEELKGKIVDLQEELTKSHKEYTQRISALQNDVTTLSNENVRARSERARNEHLLHAAENHVIEMKGRLRDAENTNNDQALQLTIEKRKVVELETSLRLSAMSNHLAKTIEKLTVHQVNTETPRNNSICSKCLRNIDDNHITMAGESLPKRLSNEFEPYGDIKNSLILDDSNKQIEKNNDDDYLKDNKYKETDTCSKNEQKINNNKTVKSSNFESEKKSNKNDDHNTLQMPSNGSPPISLKPLKTKDTKTKTQLEESVTIHKENINGKPNDKDNPKTEKVTIDKENKNNKLNDKDNTKTEKEIANVESTSQIFDETKKLDTNVITDNKTIETSSDNIDTNVTTNSQTFVETKPNITSKTKDKDGIEITKRKLSNDKEKENEIKNEVKVNKDVVNIHRNIVKDSYYIEKDGIEITKRKLSNAKKENELKTIEVKVNKDAVNLDLNKSGKSDNFVELEKDNVAKESTANTNTGKDTATNPQNLSPQTRRDSATYTKSKENPPFIKTDDLKPEDIKANVKDMTNNTYTVGKSDRESPDNTDHEISSITDIPVEKYDTLTRDILSPGEQKALTVTETESSHTDYGSLSEGELPHSTKARRLSCGEKPQYNQPSRKSSVQMESTLQAISRELDRCQRLLVDSRQEVIYYSRVN